MAVLLHVQGSGRDPLRPFGGHAIRTVAWERFDPGSVGRDVDTIIISPPDPLTGVDAVAAIRDAGDTHPVLLVPDDSTGWRQVAATRLPGADVVLGGIRSLPDYVPSADYPHESGLWDDLGQSDDTRDAARVIDLRRHIPRGGSRRLLRERLGEHHDIASAVQEFTDDLTGVDAGVRELRGTARASTAPPPPVIATATEHRGPPEPDPWPGPGMVGTSEPDPAADLQPDVPVDLASPEDVASPEDTASADAPSIFERSAVVELPAPVPEVPEQQAAYDLPRQVQPDTDEGPTRRRTARALTDPAALVPALLGCVGRLDTVGDTATAVAQFVMGAISADAVDVIVEVDGTWQTVRTVGAATGAGGAVDVVEAVGLVAWLESFDSPVVLDGNDLAAPGSWVLAGLARASGPTVAVILVWREPGSPVFEPSSVTTLAELAADATAPLSLALGVRQLARALAAHAH